jgi:succinate dehydrogenase cytochrome b556 subunit
MCKKQFKPFIFQRLEYLPGVAFYAKTRGWHFVMAWIHRITGILLALYTGVHIYTLSLLASPDNYDAKMKLFGIFIFALLEWLLAIPVIFHGLNGGRLILYEIFGSRNNDSMVQWVFSLALIYVLLQGLLMVIGNQIVSPIFFWLITFIVAISLGYVVTSRIWETGASVAWKLHRITGSFLLIMIPAHLLFMHLQPATGHEASVVVARMQNIYVKFVDLALVSGVLYHAGYGLISISKDYLKSNLLQQGFAALVVLIMVVVGWMGITLTVLL